MYYVVSLSEVTPARLMYYQVFAKTIDTIQELTYALCNGLWHVIVCLQHFHICLCNDL